MWATDFRLMNSDGDWWVGAAGKGISQEEGNSRLAPSSFNVAVWGRLEQLNLNMQVQSVCSRCKVSDVINFRLEQVISPRWLLSEVVVRAACTLTTTSMLLAVGCVGVDAQLALVSSSSVVCGVGF